MSTLDRWRVKEGDPTFGAKKWNAFVQWIASGMLIPGQSTGLSIRQGVGGTTISLKQGVQGTPLYCSPTSTIAAASGRPGTGSPGGPLTAQVIYEIVNGAWVQYDPSGSIYNPFEDAIAATKTLGVLQNPDGTYSVVNQGCT